MLGTSIDLAVVAAPAAGAVEVPGALEAVLDPTLGQWSAAIHLSVTVFRLQWALSQTGREL